MTREPLTDDEIRAIAERAEAAAAGPWSGTDAARDVAYWGIGRREAMVLGPQGYSVLSDNDERRQPVAENAIFIAAARTDVPRLCADLLAARAELERLKELNRQRSERMRERDYDLRALLDEGNREPSRRSHVERRAVELVREAREQRDEARRVLGELVEALNGCKVYYRHEVSVAAGSGRRNFNDAIAAARAFVGEAKG